ncbi:hypothetical protein B0H16DRAFT_1462301 [Mycena metata]|uniref:Uncharacterized protein n=1 Tax=Mycena metata TaxID=1033252 RepID=A0AAD7N612_9AGAR|nr:hypothetical protein B0H16DRAFT_1462301 [Mycena metata]
MPCAVQHGALIHAQLRAFKQEESRHVVTPPLTKTTSCRLTISHSFSQMDYSALVALAVTTLRARKRQFSNTEQTAPKKGNTVRFRTGGLSDLFTGLHAELYDTLRHHSELGIAAVTVIMAALEPALRNGEGFFIPDAKPHDYVGAIVGVRAWVEEELGDVLDAVGEAAGPLITKHSINALLDDFNSLDLEAAVIAAPVPDTTREAMLVALRAETERTSPRLPVQRPGHDFRFVPKYEDKENGESRITLRRCIVLTASTASPSSPPSKRSRLGPLLLLPSPALSAPRTPSRRVRTSGRGGNEALISFLPRALTFNNEFSLQPPMEGVTRDSTAELAPSLRDIAGRTETTVGLKSN